MRVAVQKIDGVESVEVSLQRAVADIRLRRGNTLAMDRLRQIVRNNGFTPKDATVTAIGRLVDRGGTTAIELGPNQVMGLAPDPKQPSAYKAAGDLIASPQPGLVEVTGALKATDGTPDVIVLSAIRPLAQ